MAQQVVNFIINFFRYFVNIFIDGIIDPFVNSFLSQLPNWSSYQQDILTYLNDYFFKGISFAREVFLNITGYPAALLSILISVLLLKFGGMLTCFVIKHALNAYSILRTGSSAQRFFSSKSK